MGEVAVAASRRKAAGGRAPVPMVVEEAVVAAQVYVGAEMVDPCPTAQMGRLPGGPATTWDNPAVAVVVEEISSRWAVRGALEARVYRSRRVVVCFVASSTWPCDGETLNSDGGGGGGGAGGIST